MKEGYSYHKQDNGFVGREPDETCQHGFLRTWGIWFYGNCFSGNEKWAGGFKTARDAMHAAPFPREIPWVRGK